MPIVDYQNQQQIAIQKITALQKKQKQKIGADISFSRGSGADAYGLEVFLRHSNSVSDVIQRYRDGEKIMMTLSQNPSDTAIYLLLDLHRNFQPLKMQACSDLQMVLKILKAAKMMKVKVEIDATDRALLESEFKTRPPPKNRLKIL
jgi:hypothetical protein